MNQQTDRWLRGRLGALAYILIAVLTVGVPLVMHDGDPDLIDALAERAEPVVAVTTTTTAMPASTRAPQGSTLSMSPPEIQTAVAPATAATAIAEATTLPLSTVPTTKPPTTPAPTTVPTTKPPTTPAPTTVPTTKPPRTTTEPPTTQPPTTAATTTSTAPAPPVAMGLAVLNAATGETYDGGDIILFTVEAFAPSGTESVRFSMSGPFNSTKLERSARWTLFGNSGNRLGGRLAFPGSYTVTAEAYSGNGGDSTLLAVGSTTFTFG